MATNPIRVEAPTLAPHLVLDAPVRRVTLLEDRAQVTRAGTLRLTPGSHRVKVVSVSPVIADRSVVARAPDGVRVDETRVVRQWRIGAAEKPADAAQLAEEMAKLGSEIRYRNLLLSVAVERLGSLDEASDLLVEGIARELPFAKQFDSSWETDLAALQKQARESDAAVRAARVELREMLSRLEAMRLRLASTGRVDHVFACDLEIELTVEGGGEHELTVDYMVPCALWRPIHRATLGGGPGNVRFECEGAVWQRTGEDWVDVDLSFSTARSTQRSEPPVMSDDWIRVEKKQERKTVVGVREEEIETTGEDQKPATGAGSGGGSPDLPGVDDGGETRRLGASRKATIPSDGRLYRVPIFAFDAPAEVDRIARPERSPLVHLRSRQANASKQPLLAGPLELLRESGYVGRGQIEFVAPGEKFAIGWGGEDSLRVKRERRTHRETGKLTGKQTITHTVELFLSNLAETAAAFRLEERIPVSEIEKVSVAIDEKETSPKAAADEQGIVGWSISLPPKGTQKVTLVYVLVASSDVQGL